MPSKNTDKASKPSRPAAARRSEHLVEADEIAFDDEDFELPPLTAAEALDARPHPVELPAPINPDGGKKVSVETHRNLFCVHYDACLDEAVKRGWNSFTCVRCNLFNGERDEFEGVGRFATQRKGW